MTALLSSIALALWLSAAAPAEITVQAGEDLPKVARRALGDERAASELKALNGLESEALREGTVLKLPGPGRALAVSALTAARNALRQAGADGPRNIEAARQLADAEALFQAAKYQEAAKAADGAWRLVSADARGPTQFSVHVDGDGKTEVKAKAGQPVRVEAEGVVQPLYPGETVVVTKGEPPKKAGEEPPHPALEAPIPLFPAEKAKLELKPSPGGLGPIALSWKAVAGAAAYEVEVVPAAGGKPLSLRVEKPEAKIDALPAGKYTWTLRALSEKGRSERSAKLLFEVAPDTLFLKVKTTKWK